MTKLNLFVFAVLACLVMACNKKQNEVKPQQDPASSLPHYDESNSKKVDWDQLPDELKNAIPLSSPNAKVATSYYSYAVGPWGGGGGSAYYIYPPSGSRIYAIAVRSGSLIDRLTVWYQTSGGTIYVGGDVGGGGGGYYLQYFASDEYIYAINGRTGSYVDRLSFYTNYKSFTYGGTGGSPFYSSVGAGYQILGFFGGAGSYIDRIGFYVYTR